jgi:hypothetical protein
MIPTPTQDAGPRTELSSHDSAAPPAAAHGDALHIVYTRIQGALKNLGHRVARSTVATILKEQGIPPSDERPTSWQTFLRAHWWAFVAADFFTTEVWTVRGLVTYYRVFVIELHSRRVHLLGSTPHPDEAFMLQIARHLTDAADGVLDRPRFLICDRDRKWSSRPFGSCSRRRVRA